MTPSKLLSLKVVLATAILMTALFAWFLVRAEAWSSPPFLPLLVLCELPLIFSLLYVSRGQPVRSAQGAGIAFASACIFSLSVPLQYFGTVMAIWDNDKIYVNLVALKHLFPYLMACSVVLAIAAFPAGRGLRRAFYAGAGVATVYAFLAIFLASISSVPGSAARKEQQTWIVPSNVIVPAMRSMTACLIRHHFAHSHQGFPRSLADIGDDWNCDRGLLQPGSIKDYWIFYTPVEGDGTRVTDFRLIAVPTETGGKNARLSGDPIMSDARGIIFAYNQWSYRQAASNVFSAPQSSDFGLARVSFLKAKIRAFVQAHPPGIAPASLNDAVDEEILRTFRVIDPQGKSENAGEGANPYAIRYAPSRPDDATQGFSIAFTCMHYGKTCIRSYFLDTDGSIHATPEPRQATPDDPEMDPCEQRECRNDPIWPILNQPTEWRRTEAKLLYTIYTTDWL